MVTQDYINLKTTLEAFALNNKDKVNWNSSEWTADIDVLYQGKVMRLNVAYLEESTRNKLKEKLELDDLNVIEKEGNLIIGGNF